MDGSTNACFLSQAFAPTSGSIQMDPGRAYLTSAAGVDLAQIRRMVEADTTYTAGPVVGEGTMRYLDRATGLDLIPPKAVSGTGQPVDSALLTP